MLQKFKKLIHKKLQFLMLSSKLTCNMLSVTPVQQSRVIEKGFTSQENIFLKNLFKNLILPFNLDLNFLITDLCVELIYYNTKQAYFEDLGNASQDKLQNFDLKKFATTCL